MTIRQWDPHNLCLVYVDALVDATVQITPDGADVSGYSRTLADELEVGLKEASVTITATKTGPGCCRD